MAWHERVLWLTAFTAICCTSESLHAGEPSGEPELFPGRPIERCEVIERPATRKDVRLTNRIPVLAEPENWKDAPGPHGERAVFWQETSKRHGYRILDRRGRLLHVLHNVYLPRWSPDGRWLAVRYRSHGLALVEVGTGAVIPIPRVEYPHDCAWSPDSRKVAFVASGEFPSAGWLSVPDTSVHVVARDFNYEFECTELAWSADSRRFVALMYREHEHGDVPVSADLWLFGLKPGACRLTVTPSVEESSVGWLDDRRVIFRWDDDEAQGGFGTVLELPTLATLQR